MQKLLIAAGKPTVDRLKSELYRLEDVFNTKSINFCENNEELNKYLNNTDTLIYYSDFPEDIKEIDDQVRKSNSVGSVISLSYENGNKLWLYDGSNVVANCIIPEEEIPAIQRAIVVPKYANSISQWVAAILIFFFILTGGFVVSHKYYMAWVERNNTAEQVQTDAVPDQLN
ncbi:MAG: hypothetical protein IJF84_00480 [Thermoguttaceae bacterium]|nr:hypothetical protein [Thermoguttaceae bacterium]